MKGLKPCGFVLDGFPNTVGQAAAFEMFMTGFDLEFLKHFQATASRIAPPPKLVNDRDGPYYSCINFNLGLELLWICESCKVYGITWIDKKIPRAIIIFD